MKHSVAFVLFLLCVVALVVTADSYADNLKNTLHRLASQMEAQPFKMNMDLSSIANDIQSIQWEQP